nr:hypothetical protein [Mycoplasmopsis bovigenitalium]
MTNFNGFSVFFNLTLRLTAADLKLFEVILSNSIFSMLSLLNSTSKSSLVILDKSVFISGLTTVLTLIDSASFNCFKYSLFSMFTKTGKSNPNSLKFFSLPLCLAPILKLILMKLGSFSSKYTLLTVALISIFFAFSCSAIY